MHSLSLLDSVVGLWLPDLKAPFHTCIQSESEALLPANSSIFTMSSFGGVETVTQKKLQKLFLKACEDKDLEKVKTYIDLGVNINCDEQNGKMFALKIAAEKNYLALLKELLRNGRTDVNKAGADGITALHAACSRGNVKIVECLIGNCNTNLNLQDTDGFTPAMATTNDVKNVECLKAFSFVGGNLISWGMMNNENHTVATLAVAENLPEFVNALTKIKAIRWNNMNLLKIMEKNYEALKSNTGYRKDFQNCLKMLQNKPEIDWNRRDNGKSPLSLALKLPDLELAKVLLSAPYIKVDLNHLRQAGIQRSIIRGILQYLNREKERIQSMIFSLSLGFGDGEIIPDCRVCLIQFSIDRQVFHCANGHYTCGTCKSRIQVSTAFIG